MKFIDDIDTKNYSYIANKITKIHDGNYISDAYMKVKNSTEYNIDYRHDFEKIVISYYDHVDTNNVQKEDLINFYKDINQNIIFKVANNVYGHGNLKSVFNKLINNNVSLASTEENFLDFINSNTFIVEEYMKEKEEFYSKYPFEKFRNITLNEWHNENEDAEHFAKYLSFRTKWLGGGKLLRKQNLFYSENGEYKTINAYNKQMVEENITIDEMFKLFIGELVDMIETKSSEMDQFDMPLTRGANMLQMRLYNTYSKTPVLKLNNVQNLDKLLSYFNVIKQDNPISTNYLLEKTIREKYPITSNMSTDLLHRYLWSFNTLINEEPKDFQRLKDIFSILNYHSKIVAKFEEKPEVLNQEFINEIRKIGSEKLSELNYSNSDEKMRYVCYLIIQAIKDGEEVTEELLSDAMENAGSSFRKNYFRILVRLYYYGHNINILNKELESILSGYTDLGIKTFSFLSNQSIGTSWASAALYNTVKFKGNSTNQIAIEFSSEYDNQVAISCYNNDNVDQPDIFNIEDLTYEQLTKSINKRLSFLETKVEKEVSMDYNVIYFGAPGSSKSHSLDEFIKDYKSKRVTFHSDFEYSDFIGSIRPVVVDKVLTYDFVPGVFTKLLKEAYNNPLEPHFLVIEELTRGNCSAIFGDVFQLLDRNNDGSSKYPINNTLLEEYLEQEEIILPSNFYIYATVNSSDQSVYPMDTAFKRRFEFKYFEPLGKDCPNFEILNTTWDKLASNINKFIVEQPHLGEDKQIGAYFIKDETGLKKLLMYLWFDIDKYVSNENDRITNNEFKEYAKYISDDNLEFDKLFSKNFVSKYND